MSVTSKLIHFLMKLVGSRRLIKRFLAKLPRSGGLVVAERFARDTAARDWQLRGCNLVTVSSAENANQALDHIYFLHGGAYVLEGAPLH